MYAEFDLSNQVFKNTGRSSLEIAPFAKSSYLKYLCYKTKHNIKFNNFRTSKAQNKDWTKMNGLKIRDVPENNSADNQVSPVKPHKLIPFFEGILTSEVGAEGIVP